LVLAVWDHGQHAAASDPSSDPIEAVALVAADPLGLAGSAALVHSGCHHGGFELRGVVGLPGGQRHAQRRAVPVGDEMEFRSKPTARAA
jgi:hypothetical protein